ncbi:MAG TPA: hypothetical protein DF383_13610 [Deltaproteobacteria bacterium]|nr:hypothetical protein [Deltaproteobacteria bacterium]
MELSTDIAILGGGLAAYAAALELQSSGSQVTVVARAPGASAMNSGAWDIADAPTRTPSDSWADWRPWRSALGEIIHREELHPYSLLARNFVSSDFFDFVGETVKRAAANLPLSMVGGDCLACPTDWGSVKPTAWVQSSMGDADIRAWRGAKVLVVGIQGFPQFQSRFIQRALFGAQERQKQAHLDFAGSFDIDLPELFGRASLHPVTLAQALDQEEIFAAFSRELVRYLEGKVYTHLLLPPVLGLENTDAILTALRRISGLQAAETLATPMSVPGWRLQQAMERYFQERGIEWIAGEARGFDGGQRRIKALHVHRSDDRIKLKCRSVILATGKYLGGGVQRVGKWKERIFHLPIFVRGLALGAQDWPQLVDSDVYARQPFLSAGIRINPFAQPLDLDGNIAYDNLFAAGAVLADFNPAQDRCAAGVSLVSGTIAGRHAGVVV